MSVSICVVCGSIVQGSGSYCSSTCRSRSSRSKRLVPSPFFSGMGSNFGLHPSWVAAIIALNLAKNFNFDAERCHCEFCGIYSITCMNSKHEGICESCSNLDLPF